MDWQLLLYHSLAPLLDGLHGLLTQVLVLTGQGGVLSPVLPGVAGGPAHTVARVHLVLWAALPGSLCW